MNAARIVHEVPGRLRLKLATDGASVAFASVLDTVPGVRRTRVNRRARSIIVEHDQRPGVRAGVRAAILGPLPVALPGPLPGHDATPPERRPAIAASKLDAGTPGPGLLRPVSAGAAVLAVMALPTSLSRLVTLANVAGTLARGAVTLLRRGIKIEVLDALSIGVSTWRREYITANAVKFLLEFAGYIEDSTAHRSDDLLKTLLNPNPESVMIERDGTIVRVPFATTEVGDLVHVNAGDLVPVDGRVHGGAATIDQSSVTGESLPIPKEAGAPVLSGTVLVEGRLVIEAERVGDATTTARISRFIQEAAEQRGPMQRLAERLADQRVWITLGMGTGVFAVTGDAQRLESMFLVDYSCAIKLSAAVAVKSALYRGARNGLLIKGGPALEKLATIDTIVFDKTGTLTHGSLVVTDIVSHDPAAWPSDRLLALIASVAEHSTHPVAAAVVDLAHAEGMAHIWHEEVDFFIGHGLSTRIGEGNLRIGSRHYLEDHEQVPMFKHDAELKRLEHDGRTLLHVALDGRALGAIALRDRPREDAAATVDRLRALGIRKVVMVTGDRRETALRVAENLDLDDVIWEADPERKADILAALRRDGASVGFVGDGVNDGPALITADIGVAMPMAADIARATAEVVLLDNRLDALADAVALAKGTLALIRRGFATAVGVNTTIMAAASLGWLPPLASSVLHNGTTMALLADALSGTRIAKPAAGDRP